MKALVKEGGRLRLRERPRPEPARDEVLVRVAAAGVCRTDLFAARGLVPCADPVVLGHEFSGVDDASGERVAVMPALPCAPCGPARPCAHFTMLGVDRDGAFAEYVAVPRAAVRPLPGGVSFAEGAYAEPVAAALAVLRTGIRPGQHGLVYGNNRISRLTARLLRSRGFDAAEAVDAPPDAFDYIVETVPDAEAFDAMIRGVRPGGTIVLKSRPHGRVAIDLAAAVRKEIAFRAASYAPFEEAVETLAARQVDLSDLVGPLRPLEAFEQVFAEAGADESFKSFFDVRDR